MGGGASKRSKEDKYAAAEPEPEPEKKPAVVLVTLVIDLDGSNNNATLEFRDNHPDAATAAREFVEKHLLHETQLPQITAALQRKIDIREAELQKKAKEAEVERLRLLEPHLHEPGENQGEEPHPHGRPERHMLKLGFGQPSWEHPDDKAHALAIPTGSGFDLRQVTSVAALARLRKAARYGIPEELLECMLGGQLRAQQINACDDDGYTPLHLVARVGNLMMAQALVDNGADVHKTRPPDDITPTFVACMHGHLGIVKYLVEEHGADPNLSPDRGQSLSPFGAACVAGQLDVVKYLVEQRGVNPQKWKEAAVYGRLPMEILSYITDWIAPESCEG